MGDVMRSFIEPMLARFEKPSGADSDVFFAGLVESMAELSDASLMATVGHFRLTRKYRTFPLESECLEAARKVVVKGSSPAKLSWESELKISQGAWIKARQLCRCDMGRIADGGGWLVALLEFCEREGRLPYGREVDDCERVAGRSEAGLRACEGGPLYASIKRLRQIMLNKAHQEVFDDGCSPSIAGAAPAHYDKPLMADEIR